MVGQPEATPFFETAMPGHDEDYTRRVTYGVREIVEFDALKDVPAGVERGLARPAVQRGVNIRKRP